jgi:glucan phosphorylase
MDRYVPLPPVPARIDRLNDLARDLWWSWNAQAREVFRDLDYPLWRFTDHNPVLQLHLIEPERLEHAAGDPAFLRLYDEAIAALDVVRAGAGTWWSRRSGPATRTPLVVIAPRFSLHQALPIGADAPAVLAGDVCKEASDLGIPLVGVGFMFPSTFQHQRLSPDGWQGDAPEYLDWSDAPIGPALCPDGSRCQFALPIDGRVADVEVWQVRAGRVTIYLLDTAPPDGVPEADLLSAAAARALQMLGIEPRHALDVSLAPAAAPAHVPSWIAREIAVLIESHAGDNWRDHQDDEPWWTASDRIPEDDLWQARQRLRGYLVDFMRERARRRWARDASSRAQLVSLGTLLDPAALTIGVVRRFSGGAQADPIFQDPRRLGAILTARRRPVQIVIAGRAGPADEAAKQALQWTFQQMADPAFAGRIAFLEDYDLHAARLLAQGCDAWLTGEGDPLAAHDAAKAAVNGAPAIAARGFYNRLEEELVPAFYRRDRSGLPPDWIARVRQTVAVAIPRHTARRALKSAAEPFGVTIPADS